MSTGRPSRLLVEAAGVIEAPIDEVWPLLRQAIPFTEENGTTGAYQGGWWYRGEWSAHPDGNHTLVTHRVSNVAPAMRWAVPLANRFFIGFAPKIRNGFQQAVTEVARQLHTSAHLLPARPRSSGDAAEPPAEPD